MANLLKSKAIAGILLILIIIGICLTFHFRDEWWSFIDIFFAFMMAFTHLMSLTLSRMSPGVGKKLESMALIFGILAIISFVVEYILLH